jgi:hypothetical protein
MLVQRVEVQKEKHGNSTNKQLLFQSTSKTQLVYRLRKKSLLPKEPEIFFIPIALFKHQIPV